MPVAVLTFVLIEVKLMVLNAPPFALFIPIPKMIPVAESIIAKMSVVLTVVPTVAILLLAVKSLPASPVVFVALFKLTLLVKVTNHTLALAVVNLQSQLHPVLTLQFPPLVLPLRLEL